MTDKSPIQCALDQNKLDNIDTTVMKISRQLEVLNSREGPIAELDKRVGAVELSDQQAHSKIETVGNNVDDADKKYNSLILKASAVIGPMAAAIGAAVAHLMK